jgi:hypothetical protein
MSDPIVTPVEEILGYKISETAYLTPKRKKKVEDVLNQK